MRVFVCVCAQVGIMVGGRFRCMGNVQRLKQRFGQGFTVQLKITSTPDKDPDAAIAEVKHFCVTSQAVVGP